MNCPKITPNQPLCLQIFEKAISTNNICKILGGFDRQLVRLVI